MDRASFDRALIAAPLVLAGATAAAVAVQPALFAILFVLDLWLLAFPHVIATFTRLVFDSESFRRHRFLAVGLPPLMAAAIAAVVLWKGYEPIVTLYFYWQWLHYTRQSHGLERILWHKTAGPAAGAHAGRWLLHLVALWGLLNRCHQAQPAFLTMTLAWLPVPGWLVALAGAAALAAFVVWLPSAWAAGANAARHTAFVLSHVAVFVVGYGLVPDVSHGWLVVNIWHNAQYMMIVWYFNATRFRAGVDPQHAFLSTISQPRHVLLFVVVCLGLSAALYLPLHYVVPAAVGGFPVAVVLAQLLNFHHYVVDSRVWRLRQPAVRAGLGLA
jgi:hypothetical protein